MSTEIFSEALLLLCVWLLLWERFSLALLSGAFFGVATLTKAQLFLAPGFLLLGVFFAAPSWAFVQDAGWIGVCRLHGGNYRDCALDVPKLYSLRRIHSRFYERWMDAADRQQP